MPGPFTHPPSSTWSRIDGIDLLRGLSILFVLCNHVNMQLLGARIPYLKALPPQLASTLAWNGQAAVQMFFVISGFLITSTSIRRWKSPETLNFREFYTLRFARIAPLMLLLLLLLSILHLAHVPSFVVPQKRGGLGAALFAALTFHVGYLEATRGYLPGSWDILWSLSVEEMFYLFFPLAARLLRKQWILIALLIVFILAGPFARIQPFNMNPVWREYSYLGGMDAIALGCLTAILLAGKQFTRSSVYLCAALGATITTFCLAFSLQAYRWGLGKTGLYFTLLAVGVCLLLTAASQSGWRSPRAFFPLLILGQRSYEIYLTHIFAVVAFFAAFTHLGQPLKGVPILFLAVIFTAGLLGWVVSVLYAEPMNRLIRRRSGTNREALGAALPEVD